MGQVLGFAHCKEAPSTASTTPDSTEGGNEDSDFPELPAPEPPEEEDDDDDDEDEDEDEAGAAAAAAAAARGPPRDPPRELTFSYIAFLGGAPRPRRDPRRGRAPRLSSGGSPRGPDPRAAPRAPPRRAPGPPEGSAEPGGALPGAGGARVEETPKRLAAPAPLPAPPPGGAPRPPLPEPPPASAPPPPPADQSASAAGADGQGGPEGAGPRPRPAPRAAGGGRAEPGAAAALGAVPGATRGDGHAHPDPPLPRAQRPRVPQGVVCAFTFPVLYRRHQAQIEQYLGLLRSHLSHLRARVLAKLPSAKVKPQ
ncbi:reticulon-2 isoform X4 [Chamaea fasciata]|uniref:reticulon-2 isoform X4 n=1 Tax=Chamaea fasciata TaxID=190680 RepID=UPI00336A95C8